MDTLVIIIAGLIFVGIVVYWVNDQQPKTLWEWIIALLSGIVIAIVNIGILIIVNYMDCSATIGDFS